MSEAKEDPEPGYDLLDAVGGGLEKCARTLFGQPGELSPAISESLNTQCGHLKSLEEVLENRGDAEDERATCNEAPAVLPSSLTTAAIKFPDITVTDMPDIGGKIENITAKVLAVGNCQGFEGRELPDGLKSLWAVGGADNEATHAQRTNSSSKIIDNKGSDPPDDASVDSDLSFTSSVDCCAFLDPRARDIDDESEVEDDDIPDAASASALLVEVATAIDTFKAAASDNKEKEITKAEVLPIKSGKDHGPAIQSDGEASIHTTASHDSNTSTITFVQEGGGCSNRKGRRWTSLLPNKITGNTNAKKPHVLKHCEKGRCPAAPDRATKMMNKASSTLSIAHSSALEAIQDESWEILLDLVKANPHILSLHSSAIGGGTLLHALAASNDAPDRIVLQILSIWPDFAGCLDDTGSTPLHFAARQSKRPGLVKLFTDYHVNSTSILNINGDSPLHYAARARSKDSTLILLNANQKMLTLPNRNGRIPLHSACRSTRPSTEVVRSLLLHHKAIGALPSTIDKDGKTPLCVAIENKDSSKIVPMFCHEMPELFWPGGIYDATGSSSTLTNLPLHTALLQSQIDTSTLLCILEASPDAAAVPLPRGDLPIAVATRRGLSDEVIYSILVQDLPIAILGPDKKGISAKTHNYSWHHILAYCQERYGNVVNAVLQKSNFWQCVALAQSPSFFGRLAYDSCSESTKQSFDAALCIGGRFRINLDCTKPLSIDGNNNVLAATDMMAPLNDGDKVSD